MTYNVFSGTLNLTQSVNQSVFTEWDQKQPNIFVHISSFWGKVLQGRHALQNSDDFD